MRKDVYFDEGLRGWIAKTALKEYWRMASWYELRDLIQDGYICYCKCRDAYTLGPPKEGHTALNTDNPTKQQRRHFMSLVQTSFNNHIMTLAGKFAGGKEEPTPHMSYGDERGSSLEDLMPPQQEEASVLLALSTAPAELKDVIERLIQDGCDGSNYTRTRLYKEGNRIRRGRRALRETTSQYWERVLGEPDLPDRLIAYLSS